MRDVTVKKTDLAGALSANGVVALIRDYKSGTRDISLPA